MGLKTVTHQIVQCDGCLKQILEGTKAYFITRATVLVHLTGRESGYPDFVYPGPENEKKEFKLYCTLDCMKGKNTVYDG